MVSASLCVLRCKEANPLRLFVKRKFLKYPLQSLKGTVSRDFNFWFFSLISFPQAPEYTYTAISNFFENSRLKVHHRCRWHRWQMEKIFNQKNFYNCVWTPLSSRVNIYINFCLQAHCKVSAAWYCFQICHWCQWHRWQIWRRCRWYRWQFATGVVNTGGKFATGVNNTSGTGGKICRRCLWHRWCILTCEYLRKFSKKFEMTLLLFSGAWGKVIHEKNLKQKISWHCPFNRTSEIFLKPAVAHKPTYIGSFQYIPVFLLTHETVPVSRAGPNPPPPPFIYSKRVLKNI